MKTNLQKFFAHIFWCGTTLALAFLVNSPVLAQAKTEKIYQEFAIDPTWQEFLEKLSTYHVSKSAIDIAVSTCKQLIEKNNQAISSSDLCIQSALANLGELSEYLSSEEINKRQQDVSEKFVGIGLELGTEEGFLKIVSVIQGTPAEKAGLLAGDLILRIDGVSIRNVGLDQAVQIMRKPAGTSMRLVVARKDESAALNFTIERQRIRPLYVKTKLIGKNLGFLRITVFQENVREAFIQGMVRLEQENGAPLEKLILDVRNNPGGTLPGVLSVISLFMVDGSHVLNVLEGPNTLKKNYIASEADYKKLTEMPNSDLRNIKITLLANKGTAGAAEFLVFNLKKQKRTSLIGIKTAGQAFIRKVFIFGNGNGMQIPIGIASDKLNGKWIGSGIEPDIFYDDGVEKSTDFGNINRDAGLNKAIKILQ